MKIVYFKTVDISTIFFVKGIAHDRLGGVG